MWLTPKTRIIHHLKINQDFFSENIWQFVKKKNIHNSLEYGQNILVLSIRSFFGWLWGSLLFWYFSLVKYLLRKYVFFLFFECQNYCLSFLKKSDKNLIGSKSFLKTILMTRKTCLWKVPKYKWISIISITSRGYMVNIRHLCFNL